MPKTFHCFYFLLGQHVHADIILCESSECYSLVSKDLHQLVLPLTFSPITLHPASPSRSICMMSPKDKLQTSPSCFCPCYTSLEGHPLFSGSLYNPSLSMTPLKAHFLVSFPRFLFQTQHLHREAIAFCFSCDSVLCSFSRTFIDAWYWRGNQLREFRDHKFDSLPLIPTNQYSLSLIESFRCSFNSHFSSVRLRGHAGLVTSEAKQQPAQEHLPKDCSKRFPVLLLFTRERGLCSNPSTNPVCSARDLQRLPGAVTGSCMSCVQSHTARKWCWGWHWGGEDRRWWASS